jgi:DNA polymerase
VFDQMAKIDQQMRQVDGTDGRYKVVLTVHDEVVCVVPKAAEAWCKEVMVREMSTPPRWCKDLPVSCECESGNNYADAK